MRKITPRKENATQKRQHKLLKILGKKNITSKNSETETEAPTESALTVAAGVLKRDATGGREVVATIYPSNNVTLPDFIY